MGNPNNEVTMRQLAELMIEVSSLFCFLLRLIAVGVLFCPICLILTHASCFSPKVYGKISVGSSDLTTVDVSSKDFYGVGYDDSDKRIPDMTIINGQLGKE